jgi:hypothetical protein
MSPSAPNSECKCSSLSYPHPHTSKNPTKISKLSEKKIITGQRTYQKFMGPFLHFLYVCYPISFMLSFKGWCVYLSLYCQLWLFLVAFSKYILLCIDIAPLFFILFTWLSFIYSLHDSKGKYLINFISQSLMCCTHKSVLNK